MVVEIFNVAGSVLRGLLTLVNSFFNVVWTFPLGKIATTIFFGNWAIEITEGLLGIDEKPKKKKKSRKKTKRKCDCGC